MCSLAIVAISVIQLLRPSLDSATAKNDKDNPPFDILADMQFRTGFTDGTTTGISSSTTTDPKEGLNLTDPPSSEGTIVPTQTRLATSVPLEHTTSTFWERWKRLDIDADGDTQTRDMNGSNRRTVV